MSIILGALGGAGEAMQQMGMQNQKAWQAQDQATLESNLAQQRAEALEAFKSNLAVQTADQQRQQMVDRITPVQQQILNQGIVGKVAAARASQLDGTVATGSDGQPAQSLGFTGDASKALADIQSLPEGPDKQAALAQLQQQIADSKAKVGTLSLDDLTDQEKSQYAPTAMDKQSAYVQAATQTGDIAPADVMKTASAQQINQLKIESLLDRANDRNATMQEVAAVRADAIKYGYELRLQAAQEKALNGKIDTATSRMLITSEDANIRASTSQLNMVARQLQDTTKTNRDGKPNPDYMALLDQANGLRADIAASKANKVQLFQSLNIMPPADDIPTPAPVTPSAPGVIAPSRPPLGSFFK